MISQGLNRLRVEILARRLVDPEKGPIRALKHRPIHFGDQTFHRIHAEGVDSGISGVGIARDPLVAQLKAMMEFLERRHFLTSTTGRSTTSGMSCHFSPLMATQAAVLELVERDQILLTVYYSKQLHELNPMPGVRFFRMTHDLPIHVVMAEIPTEFGGRCYGFGSGFRLDAVKEKALAEALVVYDSRNIEPYSEDVAPLWHLVPFLRPNEWPTDLKRFSTEDYRVVSVEDSMLSDESWQGLIAALEAKSLGPTTSVCRIGIGPLLAAHICIATGPRFQELFFSRTEVSINTTRAGTLGYPPSPRFPILHPVS